MQDVASPSSPIPVELPHRYIEQQLNHTEIFLEYVLFTGVTGFIALNYTPLVYTPTSIFLLSSYIITKQ